MRKELVFAIIAGISIGLVVAFGTWNVSKIIKKNVEVVINKETPTPKNNIPISIDTLKDFDVFNINPIIKGLASANTDIIISTYENDYYTKSNSEGEFEVEIELPAGLSEVKISNPSTDGNELKLLLVFSTEVGEKLTSYVGTITDISSGAIQVKGNKGGILQISTTSDTSYASKTDLAIGDYIVAMGIPAVNKVLDAKRIIIAPPLQENKQSLAGFAGKIEVTKITIEKLSKSKINDITLPKKWFGPNVKELEVGQEIYVVGIRENDIFSLRSILTPVE